MKNKNKKSKGTKPKVMVDEYRDARFLRLMGIAGSVMRMAYGEAMDQKEERDLACNLANLIRDDLGCYASVFLPTDVVGSGDEYEDMTIDEAKEVLSRMENYDHIRSSEWDALEDAAREVLSERKEGGRK